MGSLCSSEVSNRDHTVPHILSETKSCDQRYRVLTEGIEQVWFLLHVSAHCCKTCGRVKFGWSVSAFLGT